MDDLEDCDPSVADLPIDDPRCIKAFICCTSFYAAQNESQLATPWASQFRYGHWTVYYWVVVIGLLTLWHGYNTFMDRRCSRRATSTSPPDTGVGTVDKIKAVGRFMSYRCMSREERYSCVALPGAGILVFFVVTTVFLLAIIFSEKPYYRLHYGYGSPPLAIRCGLIAFAMVPITVALSGKANFITTLTGISHERLNVVHQWVAWMMFAVSWVHAIPFFVASYRDVGGNGGYQRVVSEFYYDAPDVSMYSGTPPMAMLFGLCIFSIRQVRERFYESFYVGHILMSITFLGLLFWHSGNLEDSWAYLWATMAIWLASYCVRFFWCMRSTNIRSTWFVGAQATVKLLPAHLVRIEVQHPPHFASKPAQHCFLRFHRFALFDHHPFTIASAPPLRSRGPDDHEKGETGDAHLVFLIKVRDGFTRRLAARCEMSAEKVLHTSVSIDGPYGGFPYPRLEGRYDTLLLVAGGSGISACLPWLSHMAALTRQVRLDSVTLVWAFRDPQSFDWVAQELQHAVDSAAAVHVNVRLHVTGDSGLICHNSAHAEKQVRVDATQDPLYERMNAAGEVIIGRPDVRDHVKTAAAAGPGKRLFVFSCGPSGLNDAVANACADEQKSVLNGGVGEIKLHVESFSW